MGRSNRGFTLMEMLIVVAIIGVLVGIAIPTFSNGLEKARAATCAANRRGAKADLAVKVMMEEIEQADIRVYPSQHGYTCPKKGVITAKYDEKTGQVEVYCSIHEPGTTIGDRLNQDIQNIMNGNHNFGWNVDGGMREAILQQQGDKWDQIYVDGNTSPYYVRPKISNNIAFVYGTLGSGTGHDWNAYCIYDKEAQTWYERPTREEAKNAGLKWEDTAISATNSYEDIKKTLNQKGWKPVKVDNEIPWNEQ